MMRSKINLLLVTAVLLVAGCDHHASKTKDGMVLEGKRWERCGG